jgi:hypothetical protein
MPASTALRHIRPMQTFPEFRLVRRFFSCATWVGAGAVEDSASRPETEALFLIFAATETPFAIRSRGRRQRTVMTDVLRFSPQP